MTSSPVGLTEPLTVGELPNSPCADQPKSLTELKRVFKTAKLPSRSEITGTWVAIGLFGDARSHGKEYISFNCTGITQDETGTLEHVMLAEGYTIEPHFVGGDTNRRMMKPDHRGSLSFPVDFGGDASPVYRCRLTARKTLVCLIDVYRGGEEFKKMTVTRDKLYQQD